jgi:hypothetical protein
VTERRKTLKQYLKTQATKANLSTESLIDRAQSSTQMEGPMLKTGSMTRSTDMECILGFVARDKKRPKA